MRPAALVLFFISICAANATDPAIADLLRQGDAEVSAGNLRGALTFFSEAEKKDPQDVDVLLRISQQYSDLVPAAKTPAEAQSLAETSLAYAKRARALAPQNAKAHLALAIAYGRLADFEDNKTKLVYSRNVEDEAKKSIALDPHDAYAFHVLGVWNYRVANLNTLLKLMARYIYGGMPPASNEEAVRDFQKAIALAPQRILHHEELARVYVAMGKHDLAHKEWKTILALPAANAEDEKVQSEAKTLLGTDQPLSTSTSQPASKLSPPSGVIAPSQRTPLKASK